MDVQEDTPHTSSVSEPANAEEVAASPAREPGDQIPGGRYHIVERLSTSAISAVYKALDTVLDRPVAVKCMRLDTPLADHGPDELRERFVREARIAARLQHPNIVTIHDIIATADRGYMIMEFIEGRTLESVLESEGRLPLSTAIKILSQLSSALDYAHGLNVIHRDVKPSNILVSPAMYVWVTDFGIAKSELSTNLTMAGGVLGAPDYMSPEQAKGEDVDARSDLFSLGCILFEAVVGDKPFRSPSLTGVLLSIINDEPVFPLNWKSLGLPMELKPILHHALEKERNKRFASCAELLEALEGISSDAVARPGPTVEAEEDGSSKTPSVREPVDDGSRDSAAAAPPPEDATTGDTQSTVEPGNAEAKATPRSSPEAESITDDAEREDEGGPAEEPEAPLPQGGVDEVADKASDSQGDDTVNESSERSSSRGASHPESRDDEVESKAQVHADVSVRPEVESSARVSSENGGVGESESDTPENSSQTKAAKTEQGTEGRETQSDDDVRAGTGATGRSGDDGASTSNEAPPGTDSKRERVEVTDDQIQSWKDDSRVLHLSPTLSGDLQGVEISPEEGFLLSRIDGASRPSDIISVSPMPEVDTVRALVELREKNLIRLGGVTREPAVAGAPEPAAPAPKKRKSTAPSPATVAEVERLLDLAEKEDYPGFLGLSPDAPEGKRKSAYLKIIAKFHPDKYPGADRAFRDKLSTLCASASDAVADFDKGRPAENRGSSSFASNGGGSTASSRNGNEATPFDPRRHARELYDRALTAYDRADYWDAIQLGRQAIETDDGVAEYYGLLGRALLRNKKWRKEAADSFLKATQLEPTNVEYLGLLAAIYDSEGLMTRASSVLEKARALDPDFELPSLDETEVEAD